MEHFIHETAKLGAGTEIGFYTIIQKNVRIGANCQIGHHVIIHPDTVIGDNVRIDDHVTVGKLPMRATTSATTHEVELELFEIAHQPGLLQIVGYDLRTRRQAGLHPRLDREPALDGLLGH